MFGPMTVPTPPVASIADTPLSGAGTRAIIAAKNRVFLVGGANAGPVTPANLTAPPGNIVAAVTITPKASGVFRYFFDLVFVLSAAGSLSASVSTYQGATGGLTGGTLTNGILWESGAIAAPTGGAAAFVGSAFTSTDPTGGLTQTCMLVGTVPLTLGAAGIILFEVSSAVNISGMNLTAGVEELP